MFLFTSACIATTSLYNEVPAQVPPTPAVQCTSYDIEECPLIFLLTCVFLFVKNSLWFNMSLHQLAWLPCLIPLHTTRALHSPPHIPQIEPQRSEVRDAEITMVPKRTTHTAAVPKHFSSR